MRGRLKPSWKSLVVAALVGVAPTAWAENPKVIRIGYPGVGIGNRPFVGGGTFSVLHGLGWLESEFRNEGIKVDFTFFKGAGPALNEAVANGLLDVWHEGELPAIVARAGGLKTRLLLADGRSGNIHVAVPTDSPITRIEELRGKRVSLFKGTCTQLAASRFLAKHGLSERDLRAINMDNATGKAALTTKDVDALIGGPDLIELRNRGVAKLIYSTRGEPLSFRCQTGLHATQAFIDKYPHIVQRIVNVWVKAAQWRSQEEHRAELFQVWAKSGTPYASYKEDYEGADLKLHSAPLLDDYIVTRYREAMEDSKKLGFIRKVFEIDEWIDRRFLDAALKDAKLESHWPPYQAGGAPKSGPAKS